MQNRRGKERDGAEEDTRPEREPLPSSFSRSLTHSLANAPNVDGYYALYLYY